MKIAVVGYGVVGQHMVEDIERAGMLATIHDVRPIHRYNATRDEVNACDAAFVCVSTPAREDGHCDTSAVFDVFSWLSVPVAIIRSTVPPGTVMQLVRNLRFASAPTQIVFSPEFIGEGVNPPYLAMRQPPFVIIGGESEARRRAANVYAQLYNAECAHFFTDSRTAEFIKYGENSFLATKVTFFNEWYDIVTAGGGDWGEFVAGLTLDYRIGRSHTHVYPEKRGWGGRCLPKDTSAFLALVGPEAAPLLAAVRKVNDQHRAKNIAERAGQTGAGSPPAGGNGHV